MALIVEDGSGTVVGANSYVTLDEVKSYATARGEPFAASDTEIEGFAVKAKDYLESFRGQFTGKKTSVTQILQYPRVGSTVDGDAFPSDAIPQELKNAQCQLCIDCAEYGDLSPSTDGYAIASEKVDVIEIEYASGGRLSGNSLPAAPQFPKAQAWIDPLLDNMGGLISTVRV